MLLCLKVTREYDIVLISERLGYAVLLPTHRYLCVNSALHYLRPPLRGLKRVSSMIQVETMFFRVISPLRGLKQLIGRHRGVVLATLELLPHCGDIRKLIACCTRIDIRA